MSTLVKRLMGCALSLMLVLSAPAFAFGVEGDERNEESHNYVNERQIPDGSFLYDTSIEALASADLYYDGATVMVTGEVVGDRINGDLGSNSCWITVYSLRKNDGETYKPSSIQVSISNSLADTIDTFGAYNVHGTNVQVSGTFQLACPEHEGISDIHTSSLSVVQKGSKTNAAIRLEDFLPGLAMVGVGLLLMLVYRRLKERGR